MRLSWSSSNLSIICCADSLLVTCLKCVESHCFFVSWPTLAATSNSESFEIPADGSAATDNRVQEEDAAQASCHTVAASEVATGVTMSRCQTYVAAITANRRLLLWRLQDQCADLHHREWLLLRTWLLVKRPTDLVFDADAKHVLVADKTGDVLQFSVSEPSAATEPAAAAAVEDDTSSPAHILLGHLSMLLSVTVSQCGRFIVTSDRDEKIRVSHYPLAHNVASFCLGHKEFVGQLRCLPTAPSTLLSAAGDGTLRLWLLRDGKELCAADTYDYSKKYTISELASSSAGPSASQGDSHEDSDTAIKPSNPCSETQPADCSRDRAVPVRSAVTSVSMTADAGSATNDSGSSTCNGHSVTSDTGSASSQMDRGDLVATCFDRSRCVLVYRATSTQQSSQLQYCDCVEVPAPATTVCWFGDNLLLAVCPPPGHDKEAAWSDGAANSSSSVLVWQWSVEEQRLVLLPQHPLTLFAAQHRLRDMPRLDATVLYKQRFDNFASYQLKKQSRIQQQQQRAQEIERLAQERTRQKQLEQKTTRQQESLSCKRIRLTEANL